MDSITGNGWTDAALALALGIGAGVAGKKGVSKKLWKEFYKSKKYLQAAKQVNHWTKSEKKWFKTIDEKWDALHKKFNNFIPESRHYRGSGIYERVDKPFAPGELTHPIESLKDKRNIDLLQPIDRGAARYRKEALPDLEAINSDERMYNKVYKKLHEAHVNQKALEDEASRDIQPFARTFGVLTGGATAGGVGIVSAELKNHDTLSKLRRNSTPTTDEIELPENKYEPPLPSPAPLPAVKPEAPKPTPASKKEAPKLTARDVLSHAGTQAILGALIGGFFKPSGSGVGGLLGTATGGSLGAFGGKYLGDYLSKKFNTHGNTKDIVQFGTPYITALLGAALARQLVKKRREDN